MASRPHHHHALVKASAKHLHSSGHITTEHRNKIIKSADRGMKAAKNQRAMAPPMPPAMGAGLAPGMGGDDGEMD